MNALVGGQVDMMCDQTTNTTSQIEDRPRQDLCGHHVPAAEEQQVQGPAHPEGNGPQAGSLTIWHGLYAPKGTAGCAGPDQHHALKLALKTEFVKQEGLGAVVVADNRVDPVAHKTFVTAEINKLKPVIEAGGKVRRLIALGTLPAKAARRKPGGFFIARINRLKLQPAPL
jgi:tripartite-type tricarboxylate transporter receptor subunit TctC